MDFLGWRLAQTPYNWMPDSTDTPIAPYHSLRMMAWSVLSVQSVVCHAGASAEAGEIIAAFPRRVFGKPDRRAADPRSDPA